MGLVFLEFGEFNESVLALIEINSTPMCNCNNPTNSFLGFYFGKTETQPSPITFFFLVFGLQNFKRE